MAQSRGGKSGGASVARLKAEWSAIVGRDLARVTQPDALLAAAAARNGKALRLRVAGAAALEVQHSSGQVVERVKRLFRAQVHPTRSGWFQGAIARTAAPQPLPAPDPAAGSARANKVAEVKDPELRAGPWPWGHASKRRRGVLLGLLGALSSRAAAGAGRGYRQAFGRHAGRSCAGQTMRPTSIIGLFLADLPALRQLHAAVLAAAQARDWIDTGRARFIYRHYPSNSKSHPCQPASAVGAARSSPSATPVQHQGRLADRAHPTPRWSRRPGQAGIAAAGQCFANDRFWTRSSPTCSPARRSRCGPPQPCSSRTVLWHPPAEQGIGAILPRSGGIV